MREIAELQTTEKAVSAKIFQSETKSHYLYNVPLIPRVMFFLVSSCANLIFESLGSLLFCPFLCLLMCADFDDRSISGLKPWSIISVIRVF